MRVLFSAVALAALAACSPPVPDSAAGVGFENYDTYRAEQRARDAALARGPSTPSTARPAPSAPTPAATPAQQTAADAVAAVRGGAPAPAPAAAPSTNNPSISDEQDFQAVSARQSIESDAQRRAAQSAQYTVVQPRALPSRPGSDTPTPIEFALQVTHPVGAKQYRRSPFGAGKAAELCARYVSDELAQDAFLKAGGPQKDKLGIDPDGDGYACGWNPGKYRNLVRS